MTSAVLLVVCWLAVLGSDSNARLASALKPAPTQAHGRRPTLSRRRRAEALAAAGVSVPSGLCLELRAGRSLSAALSAVAQEQVDLPGLAQRLRHASSVAAAGGDVAGSLSQTRPAGLPSHGRSDSDTISALLAVTAACCGSALAAGLPLADLLAAAAAAARSSVSLHGLARSELAGARSSALILALLPLAVAAMGQLVGARPLQVLFGTLWGAVCVIVALTLSGLGLLWTRAITSGMGRSLP